MPHHKAVGDLPGTLAAYGYHQLIAALAHRLLCLHLQHRFHLVPAASIEVTVSVHPAHKDLIGLCPNLLNGRIKGGRVLPVQSVGRQIQHVIHVLQLHSADVEHGKEGTVIHSRQHLLVVGADVF